MTANRRIPVDVAFRGLAADAAVEARCARWVYELDRSAQPIRRCQVSIDRENRGHRGPPRFAVRIVMVVAGRKPVTTRACDGQHELQLAIADAFLAARSQLRAA